MGVALIVILNLPGRTLVISRDTTYITEPLKSNGKMVDYFAAIEQEYYTPEMKTDENGFRDLALIFGPGLFIHEKDPARDVKIKQIIEKLDLPPTEPVLTFEDPSEILQQYSKDNKVDYQDLHDAFIAWDSDKLPDEMSQWMQNADSALNAVVVAANKNTFIVPLTRADENEPLWTTSLETVIRVVTIARSLIARANYRIENGDIDGAIEDRLACARIGRFLESYPIIFPMFLPNYNVSIFSCNVKLCDLPNVKPNVEQIRRLQKGFASLKLAIPLEKSWAFERYRNLDTIYWFMKTGDLGEHGNRLAHVRLGLNWNIVMKKYNSLFDANFAKHDLSDVRARAGYPTILDKITTNARSEYFGMVIFALESSSFPTIRSQEHRLRCLEKQQAIWLALFLYAEEHGTLPPTFSTDEDGNILHSWRTLILPQLGQQELYAKIRLDEPWDSEYNKQFHNNGVPFYQCSTIETPGHTNYVVIVGEDLPFDSTGKGKSLTDLKIDGNTILVTELDNPTCWMNPLADLTEEESQKQTKHIHAAPGRNTAKLNGVCKYVENIPR